MADQSDEQQQAPEATQPTQAAPAPPPPDGYAEKPHLYALGAFAGAFVAAQVLKRITGGGDD